MSTTWGSASSSCAPPPARWRSHARAALAGRCVRADRGLPARARVLRPRRRGPASRPLSRLRALRTAPPHDCAGPAGAVPPAPRSRVRPGHDGSWPRHGRWGRSDRRVAADLERRGVRGGGGGRALRDRARGRLPGQSRAAPLGAVFRQSRRTGNPARRLRAAHHGRRRVGDRLCLAGAFPRPPRPAGLDVPDQGNAAAR